MNTPKTTRRTLNTIDGYTPCACRDCMEIAIGRAGKALCWACKEADCEAGAEAECQVPYEGDE